MKKSYEMDMCNGPLVGKILRFALPLMLSGVLQLLFNAADIVVVGQFCRQTEALAAVGATSCSDQPAGQRVYGALGGGLRAGQRRWYGARNRTGTCSDTVHTAITAEPGVRRAPGALSAFFCQSPCWPLMGTPDNVLGHGQRFTCGFTLLECRSLLALQFRQRRCSGRWAIPDGPCIILLSAGVVNVVLNLFFVIVCKMGCGMAWRTATVVLAADASPPVWCCAA